MRILKACFLLCLIVAVGSSAFGFQTRKVASYAEAPDPDYSPKGPYFGPLEIPHIVRFRELPMRMDLDPIIDPPPIIKTLDERLVPLFLRVVQEATDAEVQEVAALSMAQVAEDKLAEISAAGPILLDVLKTAKSERVRYACAFALAAGDFQDSTSELVRLAEAGTDAQRLLIEPALIRWKAVSAADLWRTRLTTPEISLASFRLATEGLSQLNDTASVQPLGNLIPDRTVSFGMRLSAAKALALLDPDVSFSIAEQILAGEVHDRILALALLDTEKTESQQRTARMCDDPIDAVASGAWQQTFRRTPDALIRHLPTGRNHRDAHVRMTAARVMGLFPNAERASWLHEQLSDIHIEVRNVARQMLVIVASEYPELKDQIIGSAGDMLKPDGKVWQGIEQSLVLLAQLQATQFSPQCVALLEYPREEVYVSAAWLIHLYPDEAIRETMVQLIQRGEEFISGPAGPQGESALKQSFLIQYGALVRMREMEPMLETKFSKTAPGGFFVRAAAMWALGLLHEKMPVPELAAKLAERVKDRASTPPEGIIVRRAAVRALGLMRSVASVDVLMDAYTQDIGPTLIPGTARWLLPLLNQPMPPELPAGLEFTGDWRLNAI